ncbi:MAG: FtsQ-type POTRA domain-containing protein, partial [Deltaproteobacteria bacterium]|nr:FtsQ-type POTRA domain-containing protein [Deltaproteobacteria bacterium]
TRRSEHEIARRAGIGLGTNVVSVELRNAQAAIQTDPWIERATVSRELPGTIRIAVVEREARILSSIGGELFLVDRRGEPFKRFESGDPFDLPVATGIEPELVARDRAGATERLRLAIEALEALESGGLAVRFPVQELHLGADASVTATVGTAAVTLQLGRPPYRDKAARAERVLAEVARRQAQPAVVFLDNDAHPERVVVRMQ